MSWLLLVGCVVFLIPHAYGLSKARGQFLADPVWLFCAYSLFTNGPYLFFLAWDPTLPTPAVYRYIGGDRIVDTYFWTSIAYSMMVGCFILASKLSVPRERNPIALAAFTGANALEYMMLTSGVIGISLAVIKIRLAGGFRATLFGDLEARGTVLSGLGYVGALSDTALMLLVVYSILYLNHSRRPERLVIAPLAIVTAAVLLSSFGGRKSTLYAIVAALVVVQVFLFPRRPNYRVVTAVLVVSVAYFYYVLNLRLVGFESSFHHRFLHWDMWRPIVAVAANLSYFDTYAFAVAWAHDNELWWGRTFMDLLSAPIPSNLYVMKPPVDEGVYVKAIALGRMIHPPVPAADLPYGSWPPQTFGLGYMSMGLPGVLIGGTILGACCGRLDAWLRRRRVQPWMVFVGAFTYVNLHITNLRIVNQLVLVGAVVLIVVFARLLAPRSRTEVM